MMMATMIDGSNDSHEPSSEFRFYHPRWCDGMGQAVIALKLILGRLASAVPKSQNLVFQARNSDRFARMECIKKLRNYILWIFVSSAISCKGNKYFITAVSFSLLAIDVILPKDYLCTISIEVWYATHVMLYATHCNRHSYPLTRAQPQVPSMEGIFDTRTYRHAKKYCRSRGGEATNARKKP